MKFQVIYADPPWWEQGGGKIKRGADRHYPLMKTAEIMSLEGIHDITDENAHLYLWATNNHLKDAFKVMEAWGFDYKTMITWVKNNFGLGQYFRGATEHCLFGVKGNIPYKVEDGKRQQGTTVFHAPRLKHSQKPEEMRELIEKVSWRPGFNCIELFARKKFESKIWSFWGNEV